MKCDGVLQLLAFYDRYLGIGVVIAVLMDANAVAPSAPAELDLVGHF